MLRTATAALLVLVLAACGTNAAADPSTLPSASPAVPEVPAPSVSPSETAAASVAPSVAPIGNPAEGLTVVQFPSPDDPVSQVFIVEADGSLRQLTGASGSMPGARDPIWSPDGAWIAFNAAKVGAPVIPPVGVVRPDGSEEHVIGEGVNPTWSPDGTRLLFQEVVDIERPLLMFMADVATGEVTDLGEGWTPRWLPDGEHIAFLRTWTGDDGSIQQSLNVMALADRSIVEISTDADGGWWSPDGSALLLTTEDGLTIADPDGSNARDLVGGYAPVWSPDSSRIVLQYDVNADALPLLAVVDRDGQELWSGAVGDAPVWSPDGTRLAVEITYPELLVQVLDAATGEILYEIEGTDPAWAQ